MKILAAILMFISLNASAGLVCTINEPFIDLIYNEKTHTLTVSDMAEETTESFDKVKLVPIGSVKADNNGTRFNKYALKRMGKTLATLVLDFKGSDAMSEANYPYSLSYDGLSGGCESETLKKYEIVAEEDSSTD